MSIASLPQQILREVQSLNDDQQHQVWQYVQSLRQKPAPKPGAALLDLAGTISKEDLRLMEQAIEEGCEQVDPNGW
jgi:hypothetical protein